jgi:hypothetical protein
MQRSSYHSSVDKRGTIKLQYATLHFPCDWQNIWNKFGWTVTMKHVCNITQLSGSLPGTMWFNKQAKELQRILLPPSSGYYSHPPTELCGTSVTFISLLREYQTSQFCTKTLEWHLWGAAIILFLVHLTIFASGPMNLHLNANIKSLDSVSMQT